MTEKEKSNYLACIIVMVFALSVGLIAMFTHSEPKMSKAEKESRFFIYNTDNIYGSGIR